MSFNHDDRRSLDGTPGYGLVEAGAISDYSL